MGDQTIPNTEDREVAMIAAALEIALRMTSRPSSVDGVMKNFATAYKGIAETVREARPKAKVQSG